jgi:hypothetical protein
LLKEESAEGRRSEAGNGELQKQMHDEEIASQSLEWVGRSAAGSIV